ncbi:MAG TPA: efflux RND transporter periplasmic adaptor subunit [Candidatus Gastranaerophilales bacterium]|nr:efflux RND transporter periplasmic adaptor subunit [Candidatus Gastranaerophilales bacterium]
MIKNKIFIYFAVLSLILFTAGCGQKAEQHHDEHAEHSEHSELEEHGEHEEIKLSEAEIKEFNIKTRIVEYGTVSKEIELLGEIVANPNSLVHIVPPVSGVVKTSDKNIGDKVNTGQTLAVIDSNDLSDLKSEYISSYETLSLAQTNYEREEQLYKEKISSQKEFLEAKQDYVQAKVNFQKAKQKLISYKVSNDELGRLLKNPDLNLTVYKIKSPINGTIIKKHISTGEYLPENSEAFIIADLKKVWANLSVYPENLSLIQKGQDIEIIENNHNKKYTGTIDYVEPVVNEESRTAIARVVINNSECFWRPGMFVKAKVNIPVSGKSRLIIPESAIQTIEDEKIVFVKASDGFRPKDLEKVQEGDEIVTQGSFILKSQLVKESFGGEGHEH